MCHQQRENLFYQKCKGCEFFYYLSHPLKAIELVEKKQIQKILSFDGEDKTSMLLNNEKYSLPSLLDEDVLIVFQSSSSIEQCWTFSTETKRCTCPIFLATGRVCKHYYATKLLQGTIYLLCID